MNDSNNKVGIDSGMLLLVDPGDIPVEVLRQILKPNAYGYTAGVLLEVPGGDCTLGIYPGDVGPLEIESGSEPYRCEGALDCEMCDELGVDEHATPWKVAPTETIDYILSEWTR